MSTSYTPYLYLGININNHLTIDTEQKKYFKFDPKTGKKTNEQGVEKTTHTLKIGNREIVQEFEGDESLRFYEETLGELLGNDAKKDGVEVFMDYENPEESVIGFELFVGGYYSQSGKNSYTMTELKEKSEELKLIFKEHMGLDVDPEVHSLMYIG